MSMMQKDMFASFPGKIILFGEYLVIRGDDVLAIPVANFSGRLKYLDEFSEDNIAPFIQYLGALPNIDLDQDLIESYDFSRMVFESDIPIGYGAGSSGALTAAVYDAFVMGYDGTLQEALASMEDYFHGSSSGIDPYISFTKKPTSLVNEGAIKHFYLLDTSIPRKTGPLVEIYKRKELDVSSLSAYNSEAIRAMANYDYPLLKKSMERISLFQYEHFQEMIPGEFKALWTEVMSDSLINIKLCGAGGGGFLLMFADEDAYIRSWAKGKGLKLHQIKTLT